jgi:hypothetical protein
MAANFTPNAFFDRTCLVGSIHYIIRQVMIAFRSGQPVPDCLASIDPGWIPDEVGARAGTRFNVTYKGRIFRVSVTEVKD